MPLVRSKRFQQIFATIICLFLCRDLWAIGLGTLNIESQIGQPLRANIALYGAQNLTANDIKLAIADSQAYRSMGMERAYFLNSVTFELQDWGAAGKRIILSTQDPVRVPHMDIVVEADWTTGTVHRAYDALFDLPR